MDGGDRWRITRLGDGSDQDTTVVNRIMLRFRPIAPKPATGLPDHLVGPAADSNSNLLIPRRRIKRKYVRVHKNNSNKNNKRCNKGKERRIGANDDVRDRSVATLQLLPDKCYDRDDPSDRGSSWVGFDTTKHVDNPHVWLNLMSNVEINREYEESLDRTRLAELRVTVEGVTDTCIDSRGLGCTDEERMANLSEDACPGFVSDGLNLVQWVNVAFKKMVSQQGGKEDGVTWGSEVMVWLVMKEKLTLCMAFTCQAKLQYSWGKEKHKHAQMVPCDVWRMDRGGFAWRLDVKAALSLGG